MAFVLAQGNCRNIYAQEYLRHFARRGRSVQVRRVGLSFYVIQDCLCLGRQFQVALPVQEGGTLPFIFMESCPYRANERFLEDIAREALAEPIEALEVEEAAPLYPYGANNLWHWTTESLPKLLALESIGYSGMYIVPRDSVVAEQSLAMFRIPQERILYAGPGYRVKRLMLPQRLSGFTLAENMPLTEFLRDRLLDCTGILPGNRRVYIRRTGRRKPVNETELLDLLLEFDFEVMTPEELPLSEQWRYMTNVGCSVMAHGANSTLILLQKPGSGVVEFFGNRYVSYNNLHASRLLRLRYYPIVEDLDMACVTQPDLPAAQFLQEGIQADMFVDTLHARIALESLLA